VNPGQVKRSAVCCQSHFLHLNAWRMAIETELLPHDM